MRCKNCGREVKSDYKYCPYCATRLIQAFGDHYAELEPDYTLPDDPADDPVAVIYGQPEVDALPVFPPPSEEEYDLPEPADFLEEDDLPEEFAEEDDLPAFGWREETSESGYQVYHPDPVDPFPTEKRGHRRPGDLLPMDESSDEPAFTAKLPHLLEDDPADFPTRSAGKSDGRQHSGYGRKAKPAEDADERWMDDAPYVSMQPEMSEQTLAAQEEKSNGPSVLYKCMLTLFLISLGGLISFFLYRFLTTPDPFQNFSFSTLIASIVAVGRIG